MNTATNAALPTENPVAHLSLAALQIRARAAVELIHASEITLRDAEWPAYQAAQLGCAHLGHVEILEGIARRAEIILAHAARG
jgi:hypothetical protein